MLTGQNDMDAGADADSCVQMMFFVDLRQQE